MKNVFIVLAHPEPQSFNGALFNEGVKQLESCGHVVNTTDLYRSNFNPVSDRSNFKTCFDADYLSLHLEQIHASQHDGFSEDINGEIVKLASCDLLIWQFPLWWFSVPAILKGWVDRVFVMGRIYDYDHIYNNGRLKEKKALLSLTVGGEETIYTKGGFIGDILSILRPIHRGILEFVGFEVLQPQITYAPAKISKEERLKEIEHFRQRLSNIEHERGIDVGSF